MKFFVRDVSLALGWLLDLYMAARIVAAQSFAAAPCEEVRYWSRIIERGARSFENYVIHKMMLEGYHNDYLANVVPADKFVRDAGRYPYLLEGEIKPVAEAFDNLFSTLQTKETDKGIALYQDRIVRVE